MSHRFRSTAVLLALALALRSAAAAHPVTAASEPAAPPPPAVALSELPVTPITLHAKDLSARDLFDQIAHQANIAITPQTNLFPTAEEFWNQPLLKNAPLISLDLDKTPLWDALMQVGERTHIFATVGGTGITVFYMPSNNGHEPRCSAGPFCVLATYLNIHRTRTLAQPEQLTENNLINICVYPDPKLTVRSCMSTLTIESFLDDQGRSLAVPPAKTSNYLWTYGRTFVPFPILVPFTTPAHDASRIATLKGSFQADVTIPSATLEVPDVMHAKETTKHDGPRSVTFMSAKATKEHERTIHEIELVLEGPGFDGPSRQAHDLVTATAFGAKLFDRQGNAFVIYGQKPKEDASIVTFLDPTNAPGAVPAKLVVDLPGEIRRVTIPVEFKDIPLP